jgi:hypothetical protein
MRGVSVHKFLRLGVPDRKGFMKRFLDKGLLGRKQMEVSYGGIMPSAFVWEMIEI